MRLSELLEHAGSVLDDRTDLISGDPDILWSDAVLTRYFNQAQERYARDSWCIVDDTTRSVCTIPLHVGEAACPIHPKILRILSARFSDGEFDLLREKGRYMSATPGRATSYAQHAGKLILSNPPDAVTAALTLDLTVVRLPLVPLSIDAPDAEPEIPELYHIEMCDWVVYRALTQPTVDSEGRSAAREFKELFLTNIRLARRDHIRQDTSDGEWAFSCPVA